MAPGSLLALDPVETSHAEAFAWWADLVFLVLSLAIFLLYHAHYYSWRWAPSVTAGGYGSWGWAVLK